MDLPTGWKREQGDGWTVDHAPEGDVIDAFAHEVVRGLSSLPRTLPAAFLYDAVGSELYERITEQSEYYLTRAEDALLAKHAAEIRAVAGEVTLVELGSGSSTKTRHLLDAGFRGYVAIDISSSALRDAAGKLAAAYPGLPIHGLATTYQDGLRQLADVQPVMLSFMGSSIGNLTPAQTDAFFEEVSAALLPGSAFLLGIDKIKNPARLEAAYDDAAGWTARFTQNLFVRMQKELGVDMPAVKHVAYYSEPLERIEIYAEFLGEANIEVMGQRFRIAKGERLRTEISRKYRPSEVAANAARFGLILEQVFEDDDFAVLLLRRAPRRAVAPGSSRHELLSRVRAHSLDLVAALPEAVVRQQHSPLMSPMVWDLMHIADFERLWLRTNLTGEVGHIDPAFNPDLHPRATRGAGVLPTVSEALNRMADVRQRSLHSLSEAREAATPLVRRLLQDDYVVALVAQHEAQHQETMLQAAQLLEDQVFEPTFARPLGHRPDLIPTGMVQIAAGPFRMGTDDKSQAYDNERPSHWVDVAAYRLDIAPVTNGAFLRFMNEGGYEDEAHWSPEGWTWRNTEQVGSPLDWERQANGEWQRRLFGRWVGLDPHRPVVHVSWFEASAYARWAGKRLPTEAEWEKAAAWDPSRHRARLYPWGDETTEGRANLDQAHLMTSPVGSWPDGRSFYGCHQLLGDVWEWTSSTFQPYPGFEVWPYPEYSEVFFGDTYRVLRGGSFSTRAVVARNSIRNWDFPQRRQIFSGFRCAMDG